MINTIVNSWIGFCSDTDMHERVLNVFGTAKKGFVESDIIIIIIIKKALRP